MGTNNSVKKILVKIRVHSWLQIERFNHGKNGWQE